MNTLNDIKKVEVINDILFLHIGDKIYRYRLASLSKKLAAATKEEREKFTVSPSGYGIHWNLIDEDISIKKILDNETCE